MQTKGKWKNRYTVYGGMAVLIAVLNLIAWNSTAFCDSYIKYVFPIWVNTYGRFMNLFPFSSANRQCRIEYIPTLPVTCACRLLLLQPIPLGRYLADHKYALR